MTPIYIMLAYLFGLVTTPLLLMVVWFVLMAGEKEDWHGSRG